MPLGTLKYLRLCMIGPKLDIIFCSKFFCWYAVGYASANRIYVLWSRPRPLLSGTIIVQSVVPNITLEVIYQ